MSQSIVLVHGVWHSPDCFDKVIDLLSAKGFTSRKVHLPSVGRSPAVTSLQPDVESIRTATLGEMEKGYDVVVICHSYSGIPISKALKGLDKPHAGGGRVSAIIYLTAFLLPDGVPLVGANIVTIGLKGDEYQPLDDGNVFFKKDVNTSGYFYNDLPQEEAGCWVGRLQPHALSTFYSPANYAAWKDIPSWFLICKQDKAITPETQLGFVKEARRYLDQVGGPGTGEQKLKVEELDAGHSPFLSRPEETTAFIVKVAEACRN
jgi:pimeloyl-ACP methyl ester carboxylesterase